jgi:small subunit ribosomal protein S1
MTVSGKISSLRDFGAFVDIGGIEGLIPVSEIGWGRVENISDALAVGEEVTVVIKEVNWDTDRISLSLKDTLADPWEKVMESYPEGSFHPGRVARLAPFGAFVTLSTGVDGLIHISRLGGGKRINHPREVLKEGENIEVKVESVDREHRRLSLALAGAARAAEEEEADLASFRSQAAEESSRSMGSLGDLIRAKQAKGKK